MASTDALVIASLTAPHVLYAFVWFLPGLWLRCFRSTAVQAFSAAASIGKVLQCCSVLLWWRHKEEKLDLMAVSLQQWAAFFALVFIGQVLNMAVYQALGPKGVYYGVKFGKSVGWQRGFPFSVVRHPQYVGAVLTIWGCMALVWGQAPGGTLTLALYWTLLYAATALWEDFL